MKKLLYSSAVLIASCGMAAAQVSVGGDASVGIKYDGKDTSIHHNVDLELALSGQTDGGLSFGAEMTITNAPSVDLKNASTTVVKKGIVDPMTEIVMDTNTYKNRYTIGDGILHRDGMGRPLYLMGNGMTTLYHPNHFVAAETSTKKTVTGAQTSIVTETAFNANNTPAVTTDDIPAYKNVVIRHYGDDGEDGPADDNVSFTKFTWAIGGEDKDVFVEHTTGHAYIMGDNGWESAIVADAVVTENALTRANANALNAATVDFRSSTNTARHTLFLDQHLAAAAAMKTSEETINMSEERTVTFTNTTNDDTRVSKASVANDASVFISGGFGKISVGAVDRGDMMAVGMADVGYDGIGVDEVAETGFRGASSAEFLYEFSAGGVSFGLSSQANGETSALGIKYSLDPISVGIGYTNLGNGNNVLGLGIGASLGGVSTNIMYAKKKTGGSSAGMDASFAAADNMTVTIAAASNNDGMGMKESAYGLGLSFDLGGGATLGTGVGTVDGETKADLGLNLTF